MKKLMLVAAIVCATVIAQAASVGWNTSKVLDAGGAAIKKNCSVALYVLSVTDYNELAKSATDGTALSKAVAKYVSDKTAVATGTTSTQSKTTLSYDFSIGSTAYTAILLTDISTGDYKDYYMGNIAAFTVESDAGGTVNELGSTIGGDGLNATTKATAWVGTTPEPGPEPTSGLLLLVGGALLGLRRRRA